MTGRDEVVPGLQSFILCKKRQTILVCPVQWVFLWIMNPFFFQICWVLPQCSSVRRETKGQLWCLDLWCCFCGKKQCSWVAFHFVMIQKVLTVK
jgi:hypothetical protein